MKLKIPPIPYIILTLILAILLLSHFSYLPDSILIVFLLAFLIYWLFEEQKIYKQVNNPYKVLVPQHESSDDED